MSLILNGTDGLSDVDGSASTPAIRGTDANTGIFFPAADTIAFAEGGTEAMRIDSSGQVGIGTNSPTRTLDVVGAQSFRDSTGAKQLLIANDTSLVRLFSRNTSDNSDIPMGFYTGATERMRIDSSGNLLVGTTASSPGYGNTNTGCRLSNVQSNFSSNTADWVSTVNQNGSDAGARYFIGFRVSNSQVGNIQSNGSNCTFNSTSDYRLKENVAPLTGALNRVSQLKPVTYKWKLDGSDGEGFIAHELQAVVPECVTGEKDSVDAEGNPKYQGVDTSFLVATLTAAIQELKAVVDAQAIEIAELKAKQ